MFKFLKSKWVIIVLMIFGVVALFILSATRAVDGFQSVLTGGLKPVQEFFTDIGIKFQNFFFYFQSKQKLAEENARLTERLSEIEQELIEQKERMTESEILKEELEFVREYDFKFVASKVIGRSPDHTNTLIINKGEKDGIKKNMPVIVSKGTLIGRIVETYETTSTLLLLTDSQSQISAMIQNENSPTGIVRGEFGLALKMELIPQEKKVSQGDWVITSGQETFIPRGLLIGKIENVSQKKGALFQEANLIPASLPTNYLIVTVIIS